MPRDFNIDRIYNLSDGEYEGDSYVVIDSGDPTGELQKLRLRDIVGTPGPRGPRGEDGVSVRHSWNGSVLTIMSASGVSSADLRGPKGDDGKFSAFYYENTTSLVRYVHVLSAEYAGTTPVMLSYTTRDSADVNISGFLVLRTEGMYESSSRCTNFVLSYKDMSNPDTFRVRIDSGIIHLYACTTGYGSVSMYPLGESKSKVQWVGSLVDSGTYLDSEQVTYKTIVTDDLLKSRTTYINEAGNETYVNTVVPANASSQNKLATTGDVTVIGDSLQQHVDNSTIHVTAGDKTRWDGKQDAITEMTSDEVSTLLGGLV